MAGFASYFLIQQGNNKRTVLLQATQKHGICDDGNLGLRLKSLWSRRPQSRPLLLITISLQWRLMIPHLPNSMLQLTFFEFSAQKILLIAQIQNIGNTSIVVSPQDCLLNNTFYANTRVSFAPNSVQYGQFVFVAPGWNFTVP